MKVVTVPRAVVPDPGSRLAYRSDIDGLRALAVALVVAYHFGLPGVGGGYLGVDLFFVVSGFLIASLFEREPTLSWPVLAGFYVRRVKRLMPAFIVVATVTAAAATLLLLPDDYTAFLKSVRESFEFKSNVYFERETTGYFAADAATLPWLHTWSLAIEWQFYAVFPALSWLLRRLPSPQWPQFPQSRRAALMAVTVVGVAASAWMTAAHPAHAYFSPLARGFEFLMGAVAATVAWPALRATATMLISLVGVLALVVLALVFTRATPFPGLAALAVCAIAVVLIATGRDGSILAHPFLAACGKRSYAIYLWHWPVVALLAYVQVARTPAVVALAWVALGCVSDATWRWIERPGIALRWSFPTTLMALCALPLFAFTAANVIVRQHDGYPRRLGAEAGRVQATLRSFEMPGRERCHDFQGSDLETCAFGDRTATRRALLIGDSHARHFEPFVQVMADAAHVKVYGLTDTECLAVEGVRLPPGFITAAACSAAVARDMERIRSQHFDYVLVAARWIGYPLDQVARLDATIATIVASGAIPVVFRQVAEDGSNPRDCFFHHIKTRAVRTSSCAIATNNAWSAEAKRATNGLIDVAQRRYPTLRIVDPQAVQCRDGACVTIIDDLPIYSDTHHLDAYGSTRLAREYLTRFGNPLLPTPDPLHGKRNDAG